MPGPTNDELTRRAFPDKWGDMDLRAVYNSAVDDVAGIVAEELRDMLDSLDDHITLQDISRALVNLLRTLRDLEEAP